MPAVKGKIPIELFGHPTSEPSNSLVQQAFAEYHCPFLGAECKKFRKSTPNIKIGTCTLGYKSRPVIICPHRFDSPSVFDAVIRKFIDPQYWNQVQWVKEVAIGKAGSVDYVATICNGSKVHDFLCVEFQAAGTTGTPWDAVEEYIAHGAFSRTSYNYGINWANQYLKTMMQQVLKKGKIISHWNRQIVFVLQDVGMDYIVNSGSGIKSPSSPDDSVQFFPLPWFSMISIKNGF